VKLAKITIAFVASAIGVLLPWRLRVLYSEALGWVANLVPPDLYQVPVDDQTAPPEDPE